MSADLRTWIEELRSSGELVEVDALVDPRLEITEIVVEVPRESVED